MWCWSSGLIEVCFGLDKERQASGWSERINVTADGCILAGKGLSDLRLGLISIKIGIIVLFSYLVYQSVITVYIYILQAETKGFVDSLFVALESKEYLNVNDAVAQADKAEKGKQFCTTAK